MADKKKVTKSKVLGVFYKGYDMNWLREVPEHPEFNLVAEYDVLKAKEK